MKKGFTILELLVTIAIFALMTSLLLAKYGTFNQGILLTNLAYDVALTIRNAQTYGLNVKSAERTTDSFKNAYGVHFNTDTPNSFIFFVDSDKDGIFDNGEKELSVTTLQRGSIISKLTYKASADEVGSSVITADVTFLRPDPNARIYVHSPQSQSGLNKFLDIQVMSIDGSTRTIRVNTAGDIVVLQK